MPEQFLHGVEVIEIDDGIRPIRTLKSSIIGLVGTAPDASADWPLDTPVLCTGPRQAATLGAGGTLADAYGGMYREGASVVVIIRVEEGVDEAATLAKVVGNAVDQTGVFALLTSETIVKVKPRILCAPGFTSQRPDDTANPVVAAFQTVAARLRATIIADGPNTTETAAKAYRADWGTDRLYVIDPAIRVYDANAAAVVTRPTSGYGAGVIVNTDITKGFWWSPSNQIIKSAVGIARPITFGISDTESEANRLNEDEIATVIHYDGFRLWGNRTTATDPLWAFLSVRRTADLIHDSIEQAHLWALDRPFSAQLVKDIEGSVREYLRRLQALGAILGGSIWLDPELNTAANLQAGKLFLDFDFEPPAPLEHLTFRAHRNGTYYDNLVEEVALAA